MDTPQELAARLTAGLARLTKREKNPAATQLARTTEQLSQQLSDLPEDLRQLIHTADSGFPVLIYEAGEALRFDEVSIRAGLRGGRADEQRKSGDKGEMADFHGLEALVWAVAGASVPSATSGFSTGTFSGRTEIGPP